MLSQDLKIGLAIIHNDQKCEISDLRHSVIWEVVENKRTAINFVEVLLIYVNDPGYKSVWESFLYNKEIKLASDEIEIARSTVKGKPDIVVTQIDENSFDVEVCYSAGNAVMNYSTKEAAIAEYLFSISEYQK